MTGEEAVGTYKNLPKNGTIVTMTYAIMSNRDSYVNHDYHTDIRIGIQS